MNRLRCIYPVLVAAWLGACGDSTDTAQSPQTSPPEPATVETPAAPVTTPEEAEATAQTTVEVVEESAGDEAEGEIDQETQADLSRLVDAETVDTPTVPVEWRFKQANHYTVLTSAQGTSSPPDTIEVAEVFWYGCPHCFNFDPYLARWQSTLSEDVSFVRLPVMWNPTNQIHARVFYTAEALDKLDEMHEAIFREIHLNQKTLATEAEIKDFFARFDVSETDFANTFRSFAVESKLKRAQNLTQRYQIRSVPVLVVNGKYVTGGPEVKTFDDMIAVAEELVERERLRL